MNDKHFSMDNLKLIISGLKVGISPDWDENDENEFGYIKNKPFYVEHDATGEEIVHQLDEKYIPDNIARAEDVESELELIFTEIDSQKMNANNPVGTGSFSMGRRDGTTIGDCSHAEGSNTTASGNYSHAEGWFNTASGSSSHAEGGNPWTNGGSTTASGEASHSEGLGTTASGRASHAEGLQTKASGNYSHAEGKSKIAGGEASHAEGSGTTASGYASHAEGSGTKATQSSQHVQGTYNIEDTEDKYAHIVGNGTSDTIRSNAHTLDWEGNAWYKGEVYVGGTSQDDENATRLLKESEIATDDEILEMLVQEDMLPTITDSDGAILTDENNNILLW